MARRWTPGSWNSACAKSAERNVKMIVKAELSSKNAGMKATEVTVRGEKHYEVYTYRLNENGHICGDKFEVFFNKDEANAYWVLMKKNLFPLSDIF